MARALQFRTDTRRINACSCSSCRRFSPATASLSSHVLGGGLREEDGLDICKSGVSPRILWFNPPSPASDLARVQPIHGFRVSGVVKLYK
jgi:hypothetical protein